jgi:hypothetical protein
MEGKNKSNDHYDRRSAPLCPSRWAVSACHIRGGEGWGLQIRQSAFGSLISLSPTGRDGDVIDMRKSFNGLSAMVRDPMNVEHMRRARIMIKTCGT